MRTLLAIPYHSYGNAEIWVCTNTHFPSRLWKTCVVRALCVLGDGDSPGCVESAGAYMRVVL